MRCRGKGLGKVGGGGEEDENKKGLQCQAEEEFRGIRDQFREWVLFGRGHWCFVWVAREP